MTAKHERGLEFSQSLIFARQNGRYFDMPKNQEFANSSPRSCFAVFRKNAKFGVRRE